MNFAKRYLCLMLACFALVVLMLTSSSQADDSDNVCSFYAKIGSATANFMLPRTLKDVMTMITGKNPDMLAEYTDTLLKTINGSEIVSLNMLPKGDVEILGNAAGQAIFQLLLSGSVTTAEEAESQMRQACMTIGYQNIITKQKQINDLANQRDAKS